MVEKPDSEMNTIGIYYNVGYHDESLENQGILDIINNYIIRHGGKHFPNDELNSNSKEPNLTNAKQNTKTTLDFTYIITPDIKKEQIDSVLSYHSNIITNPPFNPNDLDSVKIDLKDFYKNRKLNGVMDTLYQHILDVSHPYKFLKRSQNIDKISSKEINDFFSSYFNPSTATLVVIGDISFEEIINLSIKNFNHIPPPNTIPKDPDFSISFEKYYGETVDLKIPNSRLGEATIDFNDRKIELYITQAGLFFPLPSSRHPDILVVNSIFELLKIDNRMRGDFYNNFQEKANNSIYSDFNVVENLSYSNASISHFNVFVKTSTKRMKKHFFKAIDYLEINGFDQEFIDIYRKAYLYRYYTKRTDLDLLKDIGKSEIIYGDYKYFNSSYYAVNELSNDDIKRVIKTYFSKEKVIYYKISTDKKSWYNPIGSLFYRSIRLIFDLGDFL
jgi:predicted Zn-dependent peptidase